MPAIYWRGFGNSFFMIRAVLQRIHQKEMELATQLLNVKTKVALQVAIVHQGNNQDIVVALNIFCIFSQM